MRRRSSPRRSNSAIFSRTSRRERHRKSAINSIDRLSLISFARSNRSISDHSLPVFTFGRSSSSDFDMPAAPIARFRSPPYQHAASRIGRRQVERANPGRWSSPVAFGHLRRLRLDLMTTIETPHNKAHAGGSGVAERHWRAACDTQRSSGSETSCSFATTPLAMRRRPGAGQWSRGATARRAVCVPGRRSLSYAFRDERRASACGTTVRARYPSGT